MVTSGRKMAGNSNFLQFQNCTFSKIPNAGGAVQGRWQFSYIPPTPMYTHTKRFVSISCIAGAIGVFAFSLSVQKCNFPHLIVYNSISFWNWKTGYGSFDSAFHGLHFIFNHKNSRSWFWMDIRGYIRKTTVSHVKLHIYIAPFLRLGGLFQKSGLTAP